MPAAARTARDKILKMYCSFRGRKFPRPGPLVAWKFSPYRSGIRCGCRPDRRQPGAMTARLLVAENRRGAVPFRCPLQAATESSPPNVARYVMFSKEIYGGV